LPGLADAPRSGKPTHYSKALAGTSFTAPWQVRDQIDAFIAAYNQDAQPFEWTKQVVFSKHPRSKYANLSN
jgi:hypothetical protein